MVQRGVRKHNSQRIVAGGCLPGNRGLGTTLEDDDWPGTGLEKLFVSRAYLAVLCDGLDVWHHQGERLVDAQLAPAQLIHSSRVAGVAGQVEAPQAFYSKDFSLQEELLGCQNGGIAVNRVRLEIFAIWVGCLISSFKPDLWATLRAGHRLGVETTIEGIGIFSGALRAQIETRHGCVGTVIGDVCDDREARSTVGAVDKRIAVAAVGWIKKLTQAIVAGADVG